MDSTFVEENLTVPSLTLVNAAHVLEKLFKELHGYVLTKKTNIIKDLSAKLEVHL